MSTERNRYSQLALNKNLNDINLIYLTDDQESDGRNCIHGCFLKILITNNTTSV